MKQLKLPALVIAALLLLGAPLYLPEFWTLNILARALALGIVALSLTFLSSFCGMVSLCQMTIAGVAGYGIALLSANATGMGAAIPWQLATPLSLAASVLAAAFIGWISQRSYEVYLLMFTLAVGVATLFFVQQNMEVFNGSDGISGIVIPEFLRADAGGNRVWTHVLSIYWLILACAVVLTAAVLHLEKTPLGLTLKSIRDNPRRLNALGYNVARYKIIAFTISGFIAGVGGILLTWYNAQISPGSIDVSANVAILVIAVLGGQKRPLGAFVGAVVYVLLEVFASEIFSRERFNLLIGATFLLVLYFSPNGIMGLIPDFNNKRRL
jgi:branched-chain amino acid transport system permease protein